MKRGLVIFAGIALIAVLINLAVSNTGYADPAAAPAQQSAPSNLATIEVTVNDRGGLSIGGVDLATLGVSPLDPTVMAYVQALKDAHLLVESQEVNVDVQNTPTVKMEWTPENRATAAALAVRYGVQLTDQIQQRLEKWIGSSKIDVTARFSNDASKPADIGLTTPVLVDIAQNGQLTVEHFPLAAAIDPSVVSTIGLGGNQAVLCWSKGRVNASVNGAALPTVTLNPEGVQVLNQALNLNITSIKEPLLAARFGVDLSLPGGSHEADAACVE
ncbi:MAG: hypothetical protein IT331_17290 [Anaerolineae bacterium]|nr:hypothetical protein [Anaerolineae bacterium]